MKRQTEGQTGFQGHFRYYKENLPSNMLFVTCRQRPQQFLGLKSPQRGILGLILKSSTHRRTLDGSRLRCPRLGSCSRSRRLQRNWGWAPSRHPHGSQGRVVRCHVGQRPSQAPAASPHPRPNGCFLRSTQGPEKVLRAAACTAPEFRRCRRLPTGPSIGADSNSHSQPVKSPIFPRVLLPLVQILAARRGRGQHERPAPICQAAFQCVGE